MLIPEAQADVAIIGTASATPMGQQAYESHIKAAMQTANEAQMPLRLAWRTVTSLRSGLPATARVPLSVSGRLPLPAARSLGAFVGRSARLVHRFDLRIPPRFGPELATVHDLPPLRFDDEGTLPRWFRQQARHLRGAIVPSNFAADEIRDLLGIERIWVIPYGISDIIAQAQPADDDELTHLGIDRPFVLHAAGATQRKNLAQLAGAWRAVTAQSSDHLLVLAGPADHRRDQLFDGMPSTQRIGRVEPAAIARLMRRASAVVVPSVYEGFGLPALEAMASGTPVVAVSRGALPEVCGSAARMVEADASAIAQGLLDVLSDDELARRCRRLGLERAETFSWGNAAAEHLAVYSQLLAELG